MQQTSLLAYQEIKQELGSRQKLVYAAITELRSATNQEISKFLDLPINCITPRVLELRKQGLVIEDKIVCNGFRSAISWRVR
jgi:predicted transcriptional regulator